MYKRQTAKGGAVPGACARCDPVAGEVRRFNSRSLVRLHGRIPALRGPCSTFRHAAYTLVREHFSDARNDVLASAVVLQHPAWPSSKAKRELAVLYRIGWTLKRQSSSHKTLTRNGWLDVVFAFHDGEETGPRMLSRIAKRTGLKPDDL